MARIVVLQEIQANMKRVRRSLEPIGHVVIGFSSQPVAVAFLKNEKVDLIISAVHLDEGNVFDFLKWARSYPTNQSTPFIFFCAEPTQFGKHVFGAVKSAGELLGVSKYILMDTFDTIQFRCEVAKLLALSPASAILQQDGNGSKTIRVPKIKAPDRSAWQLQDFSAVNPGPGNSDGDCADSVERFIKDRKYQDQK
jgi:CheY-like chemotaxis protein